MVSDWAFVFADATANAKLWVNIGALECYALAPAIGDGDFAAINGFGRGWADFFADDAGRVHRPG